MAGTYVIAECGSCHDGALWKAIEMVQIAKGVGADAVKFQYWSDADLLADRRRVPDHYHLIYKRYAMPQRWLDPLADVAAKLGIDFMCTAYLPQDVEVVAPFVRHFKIASFEAADENFRDAHWAALRSGPNDRLLVISLGMGGGKVWQHNEGDRIGSVRYLHCVSAYPTPVEQMNLGRIRAGRLDGFSDHTMPHLTNTGALAVAAGAEIIEAHLAHPETSLANPDAPHAMDPEQFRRYVADIRQAEQAMGTGRVGMQPCETDMAAYKVGAP